MNLTKNEIEVMDVFWGVGRPLSRAELLHLSVDKSWQSNSVHILLNSLLKKGALREAGFVRSGKTYGRTFEAALSCEEYCAATLCSSVEAGNLPALAAQTGARAFHLSGKQVLDSRMTFRREGVPMGLPGFSEFEIWQTSEANIRAARTALDAL